MIDCDKNGASMVLSGRAIKEEIAYGTYIKA
jgi:hypothetical protein